MNLGGVVKHGDVNIMFYIKYKRKNRFYFKMCRSIVFILKVGSYFMRASNIKPYII